MKASQKLVRFIAAKEGLKLVAYRPLPTDRWTIGYGTTFIGDKPVVEGQTITKELALALLSDEIDRLAAAIVKQGFPSTVTQTQFDAVLSLVYNIGLGTFNRSATGKLFYGGHNISERFALYNRSGAKVIPGLVTRRLQEKEIYVNGNYGESEDFKLTA